MPAETPGPRQGRSLEDGTTLAEMVDYVSHFQAVAAGYKAALERIAAGPAYESPHPDPWSRAEAMVALGWVE
jgi:hypothetical protein